MQAVNKAVEDLGYSPNFLGRDLRKSETKRILAIIASTEQSFYSEVLRGMQDAAYMQGYDVLIATTRDDPEHEMHLLGMLFSKAVDGARAARAEARQPHYLGACEEVPACDVP